MRNTKRSNVTRADIPDEMFEEWKQRRLGPKPDSFRSLAMEATRKLGIPVRDDAVSRWLDGAGVARTAAQGSPKKQSTPEPELRSEPKPAGHPATWRWLMTNTPCLADPLGRLPAYTGSRSIPYAFAK